MAFNSLAFLIFLPVFLVVYWSLRGNARVLATLAASYLFYGFWDYRFLALIIVSTVVDYSVGLAIAAQPGNQNRRRCLLIVSVLVNLGILGAFKYFNFFADSLASLFAVLGYQLDWATLNVILPVGISFYTFQTLSYTIDVYRNEHPPEKSLLRFATFVAFFPQLVAGPIVRAKTLLPQFAKDAAYSNKNMADGFGRVMVGFFKKLVIADSLALVVDPMFEFPAGYGSLNALILVCLFSIQLYADFSGYYDIAIGCAKMMGLSLPENFRSPFFAASFREFWRRWHITLSNWLRDYVFVPLGGSRGSKVRTLQSILLTMLLGGLWHGANWTFVLWGFIHGLLIAVEHVFWPSNLHASPSGRFDIRYGIRRCVGIAWVFGFFTATAILFRSQDLSQAWIVFERIGSLEGWSPNALHNRIPLLKAMGLTAVFLAIELCFQFQWFGRKLTGSAWLQSIAYACVIWALALFGTFDGTSFVYFQF